jgi:16S rRNA (cytosine967-C5)-methyltransferase
VREKNPARRRPERRELARSGSPLPDARQVSLDILIAVLDRHRALDQAIAAHEPFPRLEPRDRAFARNLIATTLRRLGQIDAIIEGFVAQDLPPRGRPIRHVLRLGVTQLLFLGTPPHAAVDSSVGLVEGSALASFRGLVNAVLRRVSRDGPAILAGQDAARLNTPEWLWQSWTKAYGEAVTRSIAEMHLREPPLDVTVRSDPESWARALGASLLPTGSLRRPAELGGSIEGLPGYTDGVWWVQDAAAALPVRMLGNVSGLSVIDLCAAPGGKTMQLAAGGARVTAVDRSESRLQRMAANLSRLRLPAELVAADATSWRPIAPADAVLLDAPCSSTGTIRRHPDIAWQKGPEDVGRLALLQDRLLQAAATMLKPGGLLVYCVCSLQPEEGAARVAPFLGSSPLRIEPLKAGEIPGLPDEAITPEGALRTLPSQFAAPGGWDGFYAARLRRLS